MSTRQHSSLTVAQKCNFCETKEKNPNLIYNELAKLYQIGRLTVSDILKEKTRWLSILDAEQEKKHFRRPKWPKLEEALSLWVDNALAMYQNIDGNILKKKAKFFAEELNIDGFSQSKGWLSGFKKRNGLRSFKKHGESASAPSEESIANDYAMLQQLLKEEIYNQNDIEEILKDDEDELENLIAQLSETDLLNACEYICVENMEIEVSCTKAEIALDTILKFLYEQDKEFGEIEEDTKILRRLHRRVRLLCVKNLKQANISHYFVSE
ncbi:120_t:CDS:2 [Cetraspora pellucida]|uniref:120_t:CDS:1 n=1 Tax=Cetraspora pellucida TaxID=1433469 RepID=A0ACA9M3S6_9GLOM|nr:120_t:CDS:2 [Cetraspora pellucida]